MPERPRQKALRHSREAERRAATFLPGSPDARHALEVAKYWRDRHRIAQAAILPEDAPLVVRCVPADPWFEADVGMALERSWDLLAAPGPDVLAVVEGRIRERYAAASIESVQATGGSAKETWVARRDGPETGTEGAASRPRLEVRTFPRADERFAQRVVDVVSSVSGPDAASGSLLRDLATHALRADYPDVRIIEQDPLAQEAGVTVWYVFRDGRAVQSRAGEERVEGAG